MRSIRNILVVTVVTLALVVLSVSSAFAANMSDVVNSKNAVLEGDILTVSGKVSFTADGAEIRAGKVVLSKSGKPWEFELTSTQEVDLTIDKGVFKLTPMAVGKYASLHKQDDTPILREKAGKKDVPTIADKTAAGKKDNGEEINLASLTVRRSNKGSKTTRTRMATSSDVKPEKKGFDIEDPSTWKDHFSRCKNVRGMEHGLVIVAKKSVKFTIPFESKYIEKVDTAKGPRWADDAAESKRTVSLQPNDQMTIWFLGAVKPWQKPTFNAQTESDAVAINLDDPASLKNYAKVVAVRGATNGLAVIPTQIVKIEAIPDSVMKIDSEQGPVFDASKLPLFIYDGHQFTVWYHRNVTPDGWAPTTTNVNGHSYVPQEAIEISIKRIGELRKYGEFWPAPGGKGRGQVFMAHQNIVIKKVPSNIAKVDTNHGPVWAGKRLEIKEGEQVTFWGKGKLSTK